MTLPSELAMNIRILKALADTRPEGPLRHFIISCILKKLKKPNIITGEMFWRFLSLYYEAAEGLEVPAHPERSAEFFLDEFLEDP